MQQPQSAHGCARRYRLDEYGDFMDPANLGREGRDWYYRVRARLMAKFCL